MTRKQKRLAVIAGFLSIAGLAIGLILYAMRDAIVFFHAPTAVLEKKMKPNERFRLGGLVKPGTVNKVAGGDLQFDVTDGNATISVRYSGVIPDLFREGQGVVTEGKLTDKGDFIADTLLAKHDETYMPREVADSLKAQGHWKGDKKP